MQMLNKKRTSERSGAPVLADAELIPAFPSEIGKSEHEEESIDQRFVTLLICYYIVTDGSSLDLDFFAISDLCEK